MAGRFIAPHAHNQDWVPDAPVLTLGMGYEFDDDKDRLNRAKHGYGLESGHDLVWRLTIPIGPAPPVVGLTQFGRDDREPRYRILTLDHEGQLVDFVFTVRGNIGDNYRLRAISYRRAYYDPLLLATFVPHVSSEEIAAWLQQCARERLMDDYQPWPVTEVVDPQRGERLRAFVPLDHLVDAVLAHGEPALVADHKLLEPAEASEAADFFRLKVQWRPTSLDGQHALDHLFNGHGGLRYSYAIAPVVGELTNCYLLRALAAPCERLWAVSGDAERAMAKASYTAASAKLWPAESALALQAPAHADIALAFSRWTRAHELQETHLAGWGVQAPVPAAWDIKGGFVNADGTEYVPAAKEHRAEDIYRWGWS